MNNPETCKDCAHSFLSKPPFGKKQYYLCPIIDKKGRLSTVGRSRPACDNFLSRAKICTSNTVNIREILEQALTEVNTLIDIAESALWKWDEIQSIDREEEKRDQFFATIDQSRYYAHNLMVTIEQLKKAESAKRRNP